MRSRDTSRANPRRVSDDAAMSVKAQPILAVRDVRASARWYAGILGSAEPTGSPPSDHDHLYRRIYARDELVLQRVWGLSEEYLILRGLHERA